MATVPNIKTILTSNSNEHRKTIEFRIFHFSRNNQESTTIVKFNVNSLEHVSISQAFSFSQRKTLSDLTDLPKVLLQENTDSYRIISEAESLYTNMTFSFSGLAVCRGFWLPNFLGFPNFPVPGDLGFQSFVVAHVYRFLVS